MCQLAGAGVAPNEQLTYITITILVIFFLPLNYFERIRLLLQGQPFVLPSIHKAEVKLMAKNLNKGEITATFIIICTKIIHNCLGMHRISGKLKGRIPVSKYAAGTFLTKARIFYFK